MRLFIGALVLNFMVVFNEIEASGLRRILPKPSRNDREGIDYVGTSRLHTQSPSTYNNPPLLAHQALDLGGHHSYDPQSFYQQSHEYHPHPQEYLHQENYGYHSYPQGYLHQLSPAEVSHLVNRYKFENGRAPKIVSPELLLPHYPQNNYYNKPEDSQDYSRQENIDWLREQKREFQLEVLRQDEIENKQKTASERIQMAPVRAKKDKNVQKKTEPPKKKLSREENPKKRKAAIRVRTLTPSQIKVELSAMNEHANREIGLRGKGKTALQTNVPDSHDHLSQQFQHSEDDSDEFEPVLLPPHMSNFNPYLEFPQNFPNHQQNWNHFGGSGSGSHQ